MIESDMEYEATICEVVGFNESQRGTKGFLMYYKTSEGDRIADQSWLTKNPKTVEMFFAKMAVFGIQESELRRADFLENELADRLLGQALRFSTKTEVYEGESRIKVSFVNPPRKAQNELLGDVMGLFDRYVVPDDAPPPGDDDVPW